MQALARVHLGQYRHIGVLGQQRRQGFLSIAQAQVNGNARITRTQAGEHRHDPVRPIGCDFQPPGE
ncbi:hypothetical protein D3C81_2083660 [compost metagenome]